MATGIPTFRVDLAEGMIDVSTSADRLFAYCVEADKGPINVPTFVASNKEAQKIFGVNFAPHFYQGASGIIVVRVGFEGAAAAKVEYKGTLNGEEKVMLTIESVSAGPCTDKVKIRNALVGDGLNVTIDIDGVTSKNYQNLKDLKKVAERINNRFSEYLKATLSSDYNSNDVPNSALILDSNNGELTGGTNGYMLDQDGNKAGTGFSQLEITASSDAESESIGTRFFVDDADRVIDGAKHPTYSDSKGATATGKYIIFTAYNDTTEEYQFSLYLSNADDAEVAEQGTAVLTGVVDNNYIEVDDPVNGINSTSTGQTGPNANKTLQEAYRKAFDKSSYVDVIGVATLSDKEVVRNELISHIEYMSDPEVHTYRFGITAVLPSDDVDGVRTIDTLCAVPQGIDNEWIVCIGQGVKFQADVEMPYDLPPHEAVQLFTGIRSSLGYSEAIFGGEAKKVLKGVIDTLPITNDGITLVKDDIIDLNEAGICTFKKEYDEITFIEGVTTIQDEDVLSYENMMSIVAYVIKRLVKIAKPYQGQRLTEDLKSTLQTALNSELNNITSSDGTLMALEEFDIPPYDVQVYSAGKTKFDSTGTHLIRESKIIIQVRIVPIGALRDIDLHVIAI